MNQGTITLDIERFRKVYALIGGGATDGERAAAKDRAIAMAETAGLTFEQAVSALSEDQHFAGYRGAPGADPFDELLKEARQQRTSRNAIKRAEVLKRYKNVFSVFEQTDWELALRKAVQPFSEFFPYRDPTGRKTFRTVKLDKISGAVELSKMSKRARKAIEGALPMPITIRQALNEIRTWDQLRADRQPFSDGEWEHEKEVEGRICLLEEMLNEAPATSWDDIEARFDWHQHSEARQWLDPDEHREDCDPFIARLREDLRAFQNSANDDHKPGRLA